MSGRDLGDIAERLGQLSRDLDKKTDDKEKIARAAVDARHTYEIACSRAFLTSTGSMDMRKHHAVIATEGEKLDAEIADQVPRACRARIATLKVQIDTGRSLGAALRAEASLAGSGYAP